MQLLIENRESLDKISEYLYEHETITGKEFMKIFREIKGIPEPEEESGKKSFMEQAMDAERQSTGNHIDYKADENTQTSNDGE